jgi:ATP-dependent DNA helicase PIF1
MVKKPISKIFLYFEPTRNDGRLNNYNRLVSLLWLANTDIAPYISSRAVLKYIGKYCIKAEQKLESYAQVIKYLLPNLSTINPLLFLVLKAMN